MFKAETNETNSQEAAAKSKCGEILLAKDKLVLTFSCSFCNEESKKLESFLLHALLFHINATEKELNSLVNTVLCENDQYDSDDDGDEKESMKDKELAFHSISEDRDIKRIESCNHEQSTIDIDRARKGNVEQELFKPTVSRVVTETELIGTRKQTALHNRILVPTNADEGLLSSVLVQTNKESDERCYGRKERSAISVKNKLNENITSIFAKAENEKSEHNDLVSQTSPSVEVPEPSLFFEVETCEENETNMKIIKEKNEKSNCYESNDKRILPEGIQIIIYTCKFCKLDYDNSSEYIKHYNEHLSQKTFKCNNCEKSFDKKASLKSHQYVHSTDTPYKCDLCDKAFKSPNHRSTHRMRHKSKELNTESVTCSKLSGTHKKLANDNLSELLNSGVKHVVTETELNVSRKLTEVCSRILVQTNVGEGLLNAEEKNVQTITKLNDFHEKKVLPGNDTRADENIIKFAINKAANNETLHHRNTSQEQNAESNTVKTMELKSSFEQSALRVRTFRQPSVDQILLHSAKSTKLSSCHKKQRLHKESVVQKTFKNEPETTEINFYKEQTKFPSESSLLTNIESQSLSSAVNNTLRTKQTNDSKEHSSALSESLHNQTTRHINVSQVINSIEKNVVSTTKSNNDPNYVKPEKTIRYTCEICGARICRLNDFVAHHNRHLDIRPYKCSYCNKSFVTANELKGHRSTHTSDRPYVCQFCGKTYKTSASIALHRRTHYNERKYKCQICDSSFNSNANLQNHHISHTGERRFVCTKCGLTYRRINALKLHMELKHTDDKPYECTKCAKRFSKEKLLNYHLIMHEKRKKRNEISNKNF